MIKNVLSVDLESYIHRQFSPEKRKEKDCGYTIKTTKYLLDLFDSYKTKTTFFVVGEIYNWYPELIEEIKSLKKEMINIQAKIIDNEPTWDLGSIYKLERVEIQFDKFPCKEMPNSVLKLSENGVNWEILPESYPGESIELLGEQPKNGKLTAPIAGLKARYISITTIENNTCLPTLKESIAFILKK